MKRELEIAALVAQATKLLRRLAILPGKPRARVEMECRPQLLHARPWLGNRGRV
jgi:hypothetical protein